MNLGQTQATGVRQYGNVWASDHCLPCNTAIVDMQAALMQLAPRLGIPTDMQKADGLVGPATVATLQAIAAKTVWGAPLAMFNTAEKVAKNAHLILPVLRGGQVHTPTAPSPVATQPTITFQPPSISLPSVDSMIPSGGAPTPITPPARAPKWYQKTEVLIGGGVLFIGIIAASVIMMMPKRGS